MRYFRRSLPRGYYFFLDKKVAKNQDGKNLLSTRPAPDPVFSRAFALFLTCYSFYPLCYSERSEESSKNANQTLRAKKLLRSSE